MQLGDCGRLNGFDVQPEHSNCYPNEWAGKRYYIESLSIKETSGLPKSTAMKPSRWAKMFIITVCALMSLGAVTSRCGDEYPPGWEHEVFDFPIPHVMPSWTPDGLHVVLDQHVLTLEAPTSALSSRNPLMVRYSIIRIQRTFLRWSLGLPI